MAVASKRKQIGKKTRFEVFKRDRFTCQYCGAHPPGVLLHVDHITAVAAGGTNDINNLVTACEPCNLGKGARDLKVIPQSLADKSARVAESEAQLAGYQEILEAQRDRIEDEQWRVAEILSPGCGERGFSKQYLTSIKTFIKRLGVHEVMDAAEVAIAKLPYFGGTTFRYFCGICWSRIKEQGANGPV